MHIVLRPWSRQIEIVGYKTGVFYIYRKRENRLYFDMALYGCFCARLILSLYKMEIRLL